VSSRQPRPRVAISGGAGTGKTLLALLEAKRRAEAGGRPLLLCFNQLLAGYLRGAATPGVTTMSLHEFYTWWLSVVKTNTGRNLVTEAEVQYPGSDHASVILPQSFTVALDEGFVPDFDSVIVDEGQDFGDSDWLAIDAWTEKKGAGMLVLFDPNQALYRRSDCFPFTDTDCLRLTRNCRHTTPIHHACYRRHYEGPLPRPSPISGDPPVAIHAGNLGSQAREIRNLVQRLLDEGVPADDIAVLVMALDTGTRACRDALSPLAGSLAWGRGHRTGAVCVESVGRYKGLDAAVIILWLAAEFDTKIHREWVYVGLSRAKSCLYVVGTAEMCKDVL
jgi:superfamily I DNA and RNA helicase